MLGFLIPGPLTIICSWIPILGFMAPACMYVDRMLLSCTGTITGGSLWGEEGVSGIIASCLAPGGSATGSFWDMCWGCTPLGAIQEISGGGGLFGICLELPKLIIPFL